ncbi:MAG: phage tail protein [Myxococcales bacterium]|nr:phage tail protein [Myxococcales bacterium]
MPESIRMIDPYGAHYFALELNGTEVAHFQECSGLKTTATVFEIEEGGMNGMTHKRPGQSKWENIVLRYATNASQPLLAWRDEFLQDRFGSRPMNSGAIIIYDNDHREIRRYSFTKAWPVSWEGPQLNSGSSELAVETLEIAHEGLLVR